MIRTIFLMNANMDQIPALERWFYSVHAAQVARRYKPWLARHESYMPPYTPPEAEAFGAYNWRFVNTYWHEIPTGIDGELAMNPSPVAFQSAAATIPPQPTEDFKGAEIRPNDKQVLRWVQLIKYPEGVDKQEADDWYVNVYAKEAAKQPHLYRFLSYKTILDAPHAPGHIAPEDFETFVKGGSGGYDRFTEMWYESYEDWREDNIVNPPAYTKPSWAEQDTFPFVKPGTNFISSFILEKPSDDYLQFDRIYV